MITVTGATGNVGRALVQLLVQAGEEVVAVSRNPQPAGAPNGVRRVRADVGNAASLRPAEPPGPPRPGASSGGWWSASSRRCTAGTPW